MERQCEWQRTRREPEMTDAMTSGDKDVMFWQRASEVFVFFLFLSIFFTEAWPCWSVIVTSQRKHYLQDAARPFSPSRSMASWLHLDYCVLSVSLHPQRYGSYLIFGAFLQSICVTVNNFRFISCILYLDQQFSKLVSELKPSRKVSLCSIACLICKLIPKILLTSCLIPRFHVRRVGMSQISEHCRCCKWTEIAFQRDTSATQF